MEITNPPRANEEINSALINEIPVVLSLNKPSSNLTIIQRRASYECYFVRVSLFLSFFFFILSDVSVALEPPPGFHAEGFYG